MRAATLCVAMLALAALGVGMPVFNLDTGDADVLLAEANGKGVLAAVAAAERATQEAVDEGRAPAAAHVEHVSEYPNIGESAGSGSGSGSAKPPKKPKKKGMSLKQKKINAYITKIKKVEKLKKEQWMPEDESQLATKLVILDELSKKTPAERKVEKALRQNAGALGSAPGTGVELSLRHLTVERKEKQKEAKAKERKEKQDAREKREKDLRMAREQKAINEQIKKYHDLAVPKKMQNAYKKAQAALKMASDKEKQMRNTASVKRFAKEYGLNRPVEKEPDYPQTATKKKGSQPAKAAAPAAKAAAKPAAKTLAESKDDPLTDPIV